MAGTESPFSALPRVGEYVTIVADPPWSYRDKLAGFRGVTGTNIRGADSQYATLSVAEIAAMPVFTLVSENAHLYLWTTNAFMVEAHEIAAAWGFRQRTILTWVKSSIGMGHFFRNSTEHVLFCVKGSLPTTRRDCPTHFTAPRGRHSEKPDAFLDMVESMSPGPYLELFSRRARLGWETWGNESLGGGAVTKSEVAA